MNEIVVSRDGIWPGVWRWQAKVMLPELGHDHHMSGDAMTKARAWKKAERAIATVEAQANGKVRSLRAA